MTGVSLHYKLFIEFYGQHFFVYQLPASWSSGNAFLSGGGCLRFKSWAGQIGHSVANGSLQLRHFVEESCFARAQ